MSASSRSSVIYAVLAAILFGVSAPIAKLLLGEIAPIPLAALVYLGSGIALMIVRGGLLLAGRSGSHEAPITRREVPWLLGAILAGGVVAPIALMLGLQRTPAATASLLLNFEGAATALIAVMMFRESVGRRIWLAIICIAIAGIVLSVEPGSKWGISLGAAGVLSACVFWGFDNNFTRNISSKDPLLIVMVKGLVAGSFSLLLAVITHSALPGLGKAVVAMLFGSVSYGLSIVLFILALRGLGCARTGAYFGTAPFVGVLVSFLVFRTAPDIRFVLSLPFMAYGAFLLLGEEHAHCHIHAEIEHEHRHAHSDEHHGHEHESCAKSPGMHSHVHNHERTEHEHHHTPDDHHRHSH